MEIKLISEFILILLCVFIIPADQNETTIDIIKEMDVETIIVQRDGKGFNLVEKKDEKLVDFAKIKFVDEKTYVFKYSDGDTEIVKFDDRLNEFKALNSYLDKYREKEIDGNVLVKSGDVVYANGILAVHPVKYELKNRSRVKKLKNDFFDLYF